MRDARQTPRKVSGVPLLPSPLAVARQRRGLSIREAALRVGVSELRLVRLEMATQRLAPRAQAVLIGRLAPPEHVS